MAEKYKTALAITGLVTFIAVYHYIRIFNSWVDAYNLSKGSDGEDAAPSLTGMPFNDAYRYMDWLLTVPPLLTELVLVMKFDTEAEAKQMSAVLGTAAALMIALGYPGELITEALSSAPAGCTGSSPCAPFSTLCTSSSSASRLPPRRRRSRR